MRVIRHFLAPLEVDALSALWEQIKPLGWVVRRNQRRAYHFTPAGAAPADLLARALRRLGMVARFDSFFLHYDDGDSCPPHRDRRSRRRLNVLLRAPTAGGILVIEHQPIEMGVGDAVVFEPQRLLHEVTRVHGERLIWSVGRVLTPAQEVAP
jgi:hypothetical protein